MELKVKLDEDRLREICSEAVNRLKSEGWLCKDDFKGLVKKEDITNRVIKVISHYPKDTPMYQLLQGVVSVINTTPDYLPKEIEKAQQEAARPLSVEA